MYSILLNDNYGTTDLHTKVDGLTEADSALIERPIHSLLQTVASHPTVEMEYGSGELIQTG